MTKKTVSSLFLAGIASVGMLCAIGCNNDNRVADPAEVKATDAKRLNEIEKSKMPESAKKELEAHMGGAPYSNPAIAEAMAKAKAAGGKVSPTGR